MPIIVGAPRSGTTLLRFMFDSHPQIAIPPETGFLAATELYDCDPTTLPGLFELLTTFPPDAPAWRDYGLDKRELWNALQRIEPFDMSDGFRAFYRLYARQQEKPRYGDKTPIYCEHLPVVHAILPEAHFIHVIRDGRDCALSIRDTWFAPAQDIQTLAVDWRRTVRAARETGRLCPAYVEVAYEQLVSHPQVVLQRLCAFVGLEYDPIMLRYWERTPERLRQHRTRYRADGTILTTHEQRLAQQRLTMQPPRPDRACRWRVDMKPDEQAEFLRYAGDTLAELGYDV